VNVVRAQEPDLWDAELEEQIVTMLREAVDAEAQFAEDLLSGGVAGLSLRDMRQYLGFVADSRLAACWDCTGVSTPRIRSRFMDLQDVQELTNFFERRVSAYQTAVEGRSWVWRGLLSEFAAFDVESHVVESVAGGEGGVAVFEEGEADEVVAGDGEGGFVARSDADDAALAVEAGGDVEIVVDVEGHALGAAEALIEDGGVAVAVDGVDGLVRRGGGARDEECAGAR
jgi:hypothetical protein